MTGTAMRGYLMKSVDDDYDGIFWVQCTKKHQRNKR